MTELSAIGALSSRSVQLRPLLPSDGEWCYVLACGPAGERWRYRGRTPSPEVVAADLWRGVFAQFVVIDRASGERAGLVGFYNVALDAGRAYAYALGEPDAAVFVTEGFGLLCNWGFTHHGFQRIFIEAAEFNLENFVSLGDAAVVEGRLRNYELWRGRLWDLFILSLTPESFTARFDALRERRQGPPPSAGERSAEDVAELVAELWPLDSLGLVEVVDALEHVTGALVDIDHLLGITADTPAAWTAAALAKPAEPAAQVSGQPGGSSANPPGTPSGPAASSRRPSGPSMTTTGTVPVSQSTT